MPNDLLTYLDLVFCAGALPEQARKVVADALTNLPPATTDLERARTALDLVVTSPEAAIQR